MSQLLIKSVDNSTGKIIDTPLYWQTTFRNARYFSELINETKELINKANDTIIKNEKSIEPDKNKLITLDPSTVETVVKAVSSVANLFNYEDINIDKDKIHLVDEFCNQNKIHINEDFFYLGSLKRQSTPFGYSLVGNEEEKNRYKLLKDIIEKIELYNNLLKYYAMLDSKYFMSFALCNIGSDYDEDIDIKLYIQKGYCSSKNDLQNPDDNILWIIKQVFDFIFKPQKSINIDEYPNYPIELNKPNYFSLNNYDNELEQEKSKFNNHFSYIFHYDIFEDEEFEILRYNVSYIKQYTNIFFPTYLIFNKLPNKIKYVITSKRNPKVIEGSIKLNTDKIDN